MVRKRERSTPESAAEMEQRINSFADMADLPRGAAVPDKPAAPDKDAKRDFKSLNLPLNEYESLVLAEVCKRTNRSQSNVLRYALLELAKREGIEIQ